MFVCIFESEVVKNENEIVWWWIDVVKELNDLVEMVDGCIFYKKMSWNKLITKEWFGWWKFRLDSLDDERNVFWIDRGDGVLFLHVLLKNVSILSDRM